MVVETVKMSSKGQIVIPQDIREAVHAGEGTMFAVVGSNDTVILKRIETPTKEDLIKGLKRIASEGSKKSEKLGIKETDVPELIHRFRQSRRK